MLNGWNGNAFAAIDAINGTTVYTESMLCSVIINSEQMQTKIGNSILLAQPRCIAAGCSPVM